MGVICRGYCSACFTSSQFDSAVGRCDRCVREERLPSEFKLRDFVLLVIWAGLALGFGYVIGWLVQ